MCGLGVYVNAFYFVSTSTPIIRVESWFRFDQRCDLFSSCRTPIQLLYVLLVQQHLERQESFLQLSERTRQRQD